MPLSKPMLDCLKSCRGWGGSIHRHPGGYWGASAFKLHESFGTSTIEGLVKRGKLEYTEWQEGRNGRFPIRATLKQSQPRSPEFEYEHEKELDRDFGLDGW